MGLSLYLARKARLEIQQGSEWWPHPGVRGVSKGQDPKPREEIENWEGTDVVLGATPAETLQFSGQANYFPRGWVATQNLFDDEESGTYRLLTVERARGSAISGAGNTLAVVRTGTTKFGELTLAGSGGVIDTLGSMIKQGANFFIVEDISGGVITVSKYDGTEADFKAADPTQAAIADYQVVQPALRWGPFNASVSSFNDLTQEGTGAFTVNFELAVSGRVPKAVIHV